MSVDMDETHSSHHLSNVDHDVLPGDIVEIEDRYAVMYMFYACYLLLNSYSGSVIYIT